VKRPEETTHEQRWQSEGWSAGPASISQAEGGGGGIPQTRQNFERNRHAFGGVLKKLISYEESKYESIRERFCNL
jgi:hypothetical protein